MQIALDAMAGDHGHEELIAGALLAVEQGGVGVTLVGDEVLLRQSLETLAPSSAVASRLQIVHCTQVIEMGEHPVDAVRKKKDASVMVAFDLVRRGEADAAVSAGNNTVGPNAALVTAPEIGACSRYVKVASPPAIAHTRVCREATGMPSSNARSLFSAAARIAIPALVRPSTHASPNATIGTTATMIR